MSQILFAIWLTLLAVIMLAVAGACFFKSLRNKEYYFFLAILYLAGAIVGGSDIFFATTSVAIFSDIFTFTSWTIIALFLFGHAAFGKWES